MTRKPAMPARTLKALKASIEKWRKNEKGDFQGTGTAECALCKLFHSEENPKIPEDECCHECPVFAKTWQDCCWETPIQEAYMALCEHGSTSPEFRKNSFAERIFLESLLPKEARK